ncbi:MAG TPA: hypothetical protein VEK79_16170 [Thermoanaerobaculia bacterium]|nr:hypothetical protein [Thermoanaerobaculia bacterium]
MSYCTSCYREVAGGETRCTRCSQRDTARPFSRVALLLGVVGMVVLIGGLLTLDVRACFAGAAIAAVAVFVRLGGAIG